MKIPSKLWTFEPRLQRRRPATTFGLRESYSTAEPLLQNLKKAQSSPRHVIIEQQNRGQQSGGSSTKAITSSKSRTTEQRLIHEGCDARRRETECEREYEYREKFEVEYFAIVGRAREWVSRFTSAQPAKDDAATSSVAGTVLTADC
ncbi:uncharacterized protein LOC114365350 isoform X2 [Ostrinia furnacalis]|uniref:uncharacterized protein LOC114365350 isoform X2 n=1 Tax=Ostrinia furnacalis TaxID=93504 RepID=UPI00103DF809|nr:uncharacterized protein LOC114365350 isoform X2 [Ostrinia furnacalis]